MSSIYARCDSQSKNGGTCIHGIPRQYSMESLRDDPRSILKRFNAPTCFKGFRSYPNDNSSTNGVFIDLTNDSEDESYESYDAQNPPQMISKAKKLHANGEPLQSPPRKILRRSIGKRDFPVGVMKDNRSYGRKEIVSGDEVSNSSGGGTSIRYCPRQDFKVDYVSKENSNVGNKPLEGLKSSNKYGDGWKKGYQQLYDKGIRYIVKDTLELFRQELKKFQQENKSKTKIEKENCYTKAANILKKNGKWLNTDKRLGSVSGIKIGDEFHSKMELKIVGLHHRRLCGIDYLVQNGLKLATSVVATRRYANKKEGSNVLVYIGEGGNPQVQSKRPLKDQKLERGNLALVNNIEYKTPVRVFCHKKSHHQNVANLVYVYEGLYLVETYRHYRGISGKLIFEFKMRKVSKNTFNENQGVSPMKQSLELIFSESPLSSTKSITNSGFNENEGVVPIKQNPKPNIEKSPPLSTESIMNSGSGCCDGCFESANCLCIMKNNVKAPYDCNGCLVRKLPLVYECGPNCKCTLSCMNRVTQRVTQAKLELFKNYFSGYGVRSKSYILKGSFICKYIPRKKEIYEEFNGVTMDVSRYIDVGRFIGNSSSPNLYGQEIIIDCEDKSHLMLFAMRNISPWEELTIGHKNKILNTEI